LQHPQKLLEDEKQGLLFAEVEDASDRVHYIEKSALNWFKSVHQFLEKLFVVIHTSSGLPAHGTESSETLITNTFGAQRSLYAMLGHLCLVGRYNKTSHNSGQDKLIPRALHLKPGQLLLYYLALVCPVERSFAEHFQSTFTRSESMFSLP
jgi:hypothetical protein